MDPGTNGQRKEPSQPEPAELGSAADEPMASTGSGSLHPQRLLRIASVTHEVLEEVRRLRPERAAVEHLRRLHGQILAELRQALPSELYEELDALTPEVNEGSLEELAVAHAEILGWLEGLFQGTQLALQLEAAQAFQEHMRAQLPPGRSDREEQGSRQSQYL